MNQVELAKAWLPARWRGPARALWRAGGALRYYPFYRFGRGRAGRPMKATLEVTYRCNLTCRMCSLVPLFGDADSALMRERREKRELETAEWQRVISELADCGTRAVTFTGGEPLLRADLPALIAHASRAGLRTTVLSNGTPIDEACAVALTDAGLDVLYLSLDGPREVHNRIRGRDDAYDRTVAAAAHLRAVRERRGGLGPRVTFSCTISSLNASHLVPLVEVAAEQGVGLDFSYMFYATEAMEEETRCMVATGAGKTEDQNVHAELRQVDIAALEHELAAVHDRAADLGVRLNFQPELTETERVHWFTDDHVAFAPKCFYPWFAMRMNPYGIVYPCSVSAYLGDLRKQSAAEIWNGHEYRQFRRSLKRHKLFPRCAKCCKLDNRLWRWL